MHIKFVQDSAARFLKENASTLLTAGGVVGTVATGVLAFRAGAKYERLTYEAEFTVTVEDEHHLTTIDKAKIAAPYVIPPIILGGATIGAIVMSHRITAGKVAALAAAYSLSQNQLEEYRAKLEEKLGIQKSEKAKAEMAQERANNTPGSGAIVIYGDEVLCFDEPTGRYFKSTMEKIRRAENSTNQEILKHNFADASHFYSELELPGTRWSDDVGWTTPFTVDVSTIIVDDKPCLSIDFNPMPRLDYVRGGDRYS